MDNYVCYHLHSDLSNGVTNVDSVTKFDRYIEKAKSLGMRAMAFSEHGSVFSWLEKKEAIEKAGMKYIHAEEFYVAQNLERFNEEGKRVRENFHTVLIAKNWDGVKELNQLSSISFNRQDGHYYFLPRITMDELYNTSDNIIVTSACLASPLSKGYTEIKERYLQFFIEHKDRCYLEIQHHNVKDQIEYNKKLYEIHKSYGIPLIVGTDTHALDDDDAEARTILQKSKGVFFEGEDGWDLTFKSYDELVNAYKIQDSLPMDVILEAMDNTNKMADRIEEFEIDRSHKYPHLWENPKQTLINDIKAGIKQRGIEKYANYEEYKNRIEYELSVYEHNKAIDFILLMVDVVNYCREHGIQLGYGRGSVTGSVVCWLLGITEMDSIKFNLNFERFMNTERVSLADIDSDIPPNRRDEVIDYLFNHKGLYCSDIITFNTIALKGAIRDVCRALYQNPEKDKEAEKPKYLVITDYLSNGVDTDEAKMREEYPEVFKYVDKVNGTVVSIGTHPCGRLVYDHPLDGLIGLCSTSTDNHMISQLYMHSLDSQNYIKLDCLALDTIELIHDTCNAAHIPMLLPDNMDTHDDKVWKDMRNNTVGIFQWESDTAQDYIKKLLSDETIKKFQKVQKNVDKMELLTIGNSAIRPAGASYRDDLANGVIRTTGSEAIDEFLKPTFGYLCYQEQIIFFLHLYCGFTMGQADIVRRGFAKKTGTEQYIPIIENGGYMPSDEKHEHYIDGFIKTMYDKYGISNEKAKHDIVAFLQVIEDASSYLFSQNHSTPYSYEGYACGWLRYYYPIEFLTTALNINADNEDKTKRLIGYADDKGIRIVAPRFRHSSSIYEFDKDDNIIFKGIGAIKSIGTECGNNLSTLNNFQGSFVDLLYTIFPVKEKDKPTQPALAKKNEIDILIKIGYFEEFGSIKKLLRVFDLFKALAGKQSIKKDKAEALGLSPELIMRFAERESPTQFSKVNIHAMLDSVYNSFEDDKDDIFTKAGNSAKILGYCSEKDESLDWRYCVVLSANTKYSPIVNLYSLGKGNICTFKFHKKKDGRYGYDGWNTKPLDVGDVIYLDSFSQQFKRKKTDDGWVSDPNIKEWWCDNYTIIQKIE